MGFFLYQIPHTLNIVQLEAFEKKTYFMWNYGPFFGKHFLLNTPQNSMIYSSTINLLTDVI